MIQIRNKELDKIALEWWDKLNPTVKSGGIAGVMNNKHTLYSKTSLIGRIKRKINNKKLGKFYKWILDEGSEYNILKGLITSNSKKLSDYKTEIQDYLDGNNLKIHYSKKMPKDKDYMQNVFNYDNFVVQSNGYWLAEKLGINVCPYCNRQYTFTIGTATEKGTRPEFDHFFDKATYPYLALSLYNLVPSCHICNSNLKGSDKFELNTHISPYIEGFENELKFTLNYIQGIKNRNLLSDFEVDFKDNSSDTAKIARARQNIKVFRLAELYREHRDIVIELIQKRETNAKEHIQNIHTQFPHLFRSLEEAQRMVIGNYTSEEDLGKRPLAKLTRDISEELGLL